MITTKQVLAWTRPPSPQELAAAQGRPVPDARIAYCFHAACPACGALLTLQADVSCSPPSEVGTECDCGALPVWKADWWYEVELTEYLRDDGDRYTKREAPHA